MSPLHPNFGLFGVDKMAVESRFSRSSKFGLLRSRPEPVTTPAVFLGDVVSARVNGVSGSNESV
jgi:hypothetical protein